MQKIDQELQNFRQHLFVNIQPKMLNGQEVSAQTLTAFFVFVVEYIN